MQAGMSQEVSQESGHDRCYEEYFKYVDQYIGDYPPKGVFYNIKIQSLLSAGRYKEAFLFLEISYILNREMKDNLKNTYRTCGPQYFDISEEITGQATGIFKSQPCLFRPDGDFIGAVQIKMTNNGSGRGLFATENIQRGDVLLISKALAVSPKPAANHNPLLQITIDAVNSCGGNARQIFVSHCLKDRSRFIPTMYDFVTESSDGNVKSWALLCQKFDELTQIEKVRQFRGILELIAFDDSSPAAMKEKSKEPAVFEHVPARMYYGVWLLPSFVNHSCVPNAARFNMGDLMRIHATRDIESGKEITIPYFNVLVPFPSRRDSCSKFRFTCVCIRCKFEANILERCSELKILYADSARICMSSELENRAFQLRELLFRVKKCERFLRQTEIFTNENANFEKWHRTSFTPVYLASLLIRDIDETRPEVCLVDDINFKDITGSMFETCPGSLLSFLFYQVFRGKVREFLARQGNRIEVSVKEIYEINVTHERKRMRIISRSINGSPHLQKFLDNILHQPF